MLGKKKDPIIAHGLHCISFLALEVRNSRSTNMVHYERSIMSEIGMDMIHQVTFVVHSSSGGR